MKRATIALALLLAACNGGHYAAKARTWVVGRSLDELESCAGIPQKEMRLSSGNRLVEWSASQEASSLGSVPLSLLEAVPAQAVPSAALSGSIPLIMGGSCRAMAVVGQDGRVISMRYAGGGDGLSGRDAICGTEIVRGCLRP